MSAPGRRWWNLPVPPRPLHRSASRTGALGAGRASEVVELGDGSVLRRFKAGGDPDREAAVMAHARSHRYPVPRVLEVRGDALVLERIEGRTMGAELRRRPWSLLHQARLLAELHRRLHEIPYEGETLLHLDFHPENVILSPAGPVVIDWTNARAGDPPLDLAMTWVIAQTSAGPAGRLLLHGYLRQVDRDAARQALPRAAERRLADPNVTASERAAVRRLLRRP